LPWVLLLKSYLKYGDLTNFGKVEIEKKLLESLPISIIIAALS
jgi:hypothetical protein